MFHIFLLFNLTKTKRSFKESPLIQMKKILIVGLFLKILTI